MTPRTGNPPPVANRARGPIEIRFLAAMHVHELFDVVVGRPQLGSRRMAFLAGEGRIDFVMADQAVRHARKGGLRNSIGFFEPAMTSCAGIPGVEMPEHISRIG